MEFKPEKLSELLKDPTVRLSGIAKLVDVNVGYLYRLRNQETMPSAELLGRLASALKKPVGYFFEESSLSRKKMANG